MIKRSALKNSGKFIISTLNFVGIMSLSQVQAVPLGSFSFQTVVDPMIGVPLMKVFLPSGWRTEV